MSNPALLRSPRLARPFQGLLAPSLESRHRATVVGDSALSQVRQTIGSSGEPLDARTQGWMAERFGQDFSSVRIHTDEFAAKSAESLNARAYTVGHHIVFGGGRYAPASPTGRNLLAHELTHVVQQRLSAPVLGHRLRLDGKDEPAEDEADHVATRVLAGGSPPNVTRHRTAIRRRGKEPVDPAAEQIRMGQFWDVLKDLNGMSMESLLKRLQKLQSGQLEELLVHVEEAKPLGDKSVQRLAAAIGAVHISRLGADPAKLDALDDAIEKAGLPDDQRRSVLAIVPPLRGGAAARVEQYFDVSRGAEGAAEGRAILEKWSTAKAFRALNNLSDKELGTALMQIEKDHLQALMMNSRQAEQYGQLKVERLRQALYVAWISRFPTEKAKFDVGESENPILKMSTGAKFLEAITRSLGKLGGEGFERLKELLTPESIEVMVGFAAAYVVSQTTPVGWVADIIVGGLIAATVLMVGREAIEIVKLLIQFSKKASGATSDADLDAAADLFAKAVSKAGIDIILAILFHKAGKAADLKPPGPRSAGLVEVLKAGGGKIKTTLLEAPATADYVTDTGAVIRVPVDEVPGNTVMMESSSGAGAPKRSGVSGAGRGGPTEGETAAQATKKAATKLPGKKLAAAEAVAKKKPPTPGELVADLKEGEIGEHPAPRDKGYGTGEKPSPTEPGRKSVPIDPRAAAKSRVLSQIENLKARRTQILSEIQEASQRGKQRLTVDERLALDREKAELAREAEKATEQEARLQRQLDELQVSPYQRARAYSYSDAAGKEVVNRARGLDEMSGKKVREPSIDHVVSVEEIVEYDGYNDLFLDDQQGVLSRLDNLKMMEKALNSSKGSRRWVNWPEGKRVYGEEVWNKMVQLEAELRRLIQADIKARAARRHR